MARCFPYMHVNYGVMEPVKEEPRMESIKLQKERGNAERKKEKKREEKERGDKTKVEHGNLEHTKHHPKKRKHEEWGQFKEKDGCYTRTTKDATEQLEKSGLTEENVPPCPIANLNDSSDSTQDSSKRRKMAAPYVSHKNRGLVFRIKLPLQKHADVEPTATHERPSFLDRVVEKHLSKKIRILPPLQDHRYLERPATNDQPCFSGRVFEVPPLEQKHNASVPPVTYEQGRVVKVPMRSHKHKAPEPLATTEQPCFSGRVVEAPPRLQKPKDPEPLATTEQPRLPGKVVEAPPLFQKPKAPELLPATNEEPCFSGRVVGPAVAETGGSQSHLERGSSRRIKGMEKQFRELIMKWIPPPVQLEETDIGEQEWLFGAKQPRLNPIAKRCGATPAEVQEHDRGVSSLQPQARYLPELDIYEMPFVIPF